MTTKFGKEMKKLIIFLIIAAAGYLIYNKFLRENEILKVEGNLVRVQHSASIESPGVSARNFGYAEGTVKNLSEKIVKNIVINYMIDRQISSAAIYELKPNEEVKFKTNQVLIRVYEPPFYIESIKHD